MFREMRMIGIGTRVQIRVKISLETFRRLSVTQSYHSNVNLVTTVFEKGRAPMFLL